MTQPFRHSAAGRIDRSRPLSFHFDGRSYPGFAGDTLAAALLANDVHLVGRSFKYHRPRGIVAAGAEEPNALVTVDRGDGRIAPNLRATQVELYDGLVARSQNRFPSLRYDLGAAAGFAAPLLSAGFYYKTFMWPPSFWHRFYEPAIRRAAGLGHAPTVADPDRYLHQYAHCDVLVIGGGPAGIAAALAASAAGERVILCDEQAKCGGSLLAEPDAVIDGLPASDWLREALALLAQRATLLPRTTAFGWYPDTLIGLAQRVTDHLANPPADAPRERLWQVRARRVVLATGAIERPLVFANNDRPGIMLADAARTYLHRYGVLCGSRVAVATATDGAWRAALDLRRAGATIAAIIDSRPTPPGALLAEAQAAGIPVHLGAVVADTEGRQRIHTVRLANDGRIIPCDTLLMSGGWTPTVHLFAQSRGALRFDTALGAFLPDRSPAPVTPVGACAGTFDLRACLEGGWQAGSGTERSFDVGNAIPLFPFADAAAPPIHGKAFVDLQNDVTTRDLRIATREGFQSIEHIKRYTTSGMATDQGKTANINALVTAAGMLDRTPPQLGLTTYRPPYTPVTFGSFAGASRGALFDPVRHTPIAAPDALFEPVGTWQRARCFPRDGETMQAAVARECHAVRNAVGLFDASTLGKIEVSGPDAGAFLDRLYTGRFSTLPVGRCRYALLLGEDGFIRDDGVIARLAADRFHVTTTTGGAAGVLHMLEDYRQTEFPELRVWLTSTTEHWAVIALQGPRAYDTIAPLVDGIDLAALPHLGCTECLVGGVPARLFRVSFTGESGFEINVPAGFGQAVWDAVRLAGEPFGLTRYGTEAMHVLRAEKGYIVIGQESDGTIIPADLGLDWAVARAKPDFVGKRSLTRPDMLRPDRRQLVGLLTADPAVVVPEGAQLVAGPAAVASLGHVTSSYHSGALGRSIALALLEGGRGRIGEQLFVPLPDGAVPVEVVEPLFYDRGGERLRVLPMTSASDGMTVGGPAVASSMALPADRTATAPSATVLAARPAVSAAAPAADAARIAAAADFVPPPSPPCTVASLAVLPPRLRVALRADPQAAGAFGAAVGVMLGSVPCRAVRGRARTALWLGPDEWLLLAPEAERTDIMRALAGVDRPNASWVDLSHRFAAIVISGSHAAWCLNAFCALDLDRTAFPAGACTRTLLGKAEIVLWRSGDETFQLEVGRSFAPYVWACLEEARREFSDAAPAC